MNKNKCYQGISCNVFSYYVKEKFVWPVKIWQYQKILGVTGPTGPVTFLDSVEACMIVPLLPVTACSIPIGSSNVLYLVMRMEFSHCRIHSRKFLNGG